MSAGLRTTVGGAPVLPTLQGDTNVDSLDVEMTDTQDCTQDAERESRTEFFCTQTLIIPSCSRARNNELFSSVPALMIAEQHGADEAMIVIQNNHHERGLALENEMLEARAEYNAALAERGGS